MSIEKKLAIAKYIYGKVKRRMQIKIFNIITQTIYLIFFNDFVY